jgi:hypothetical protein
MAKNGVQPDNDYISGQGVNRVGLKNFFSDGLSHY